LDDDPRFFEKDRGAKKGKCPGNILPGDESLSGPFRRDGAKKNIGSLTGSKFLLQIVLPSGFFPCLTEFSNISLPGRRAIFLRIFIIKDTMPDVLVKS
jgi:hypothetical protein